MPAVKSIIPVDGGKQQRQQHAIEQFVDVGLEPAVKVTVTTDECTRRKGTCRQLAGRTNVQWQRPCRILLDPMWKVCSSAFSILTRHTQLPFLAGNFLVKQITFTNVFVLVSCHAIQETNYTIWLSPSTHIIMFYFIPVAISQYSCYSC